MTGDLRDPARFEGLLSHVQQYLGPVSHGQGPNVGGYNRGFGVGFHLSQDQAMVSAATTGVRFQDIAAPLPIELVVSARPDQEDEAAYLVHVGAERVVRSGKGYEYGTGYVNAEPLIPGSAIELLLAAPHPYAEDGFDVYYDRGRPALRFITLIPATRAEFELIRTTDDPLGTLFERWEAEETDLLDIYRPAVS